MKDSPSGLLQLVIELIIVSLILSCREYSISYKSLPVSFCEYLDVKTGI
jgi:hypothetical protein